MAELPPGLMPLFFTGATQELFACVVDRDVTPEKPQKLIPLERIQQDFRDRAAVSDFHPCKQEMQAYTGTEVLVVFDPDFKYGQNFFVCLTEEAKSNFLKGVDAANEAGAEGKTASKGEGGGEEEEDDSSAAPAASQRREGGWVSLGSEKEIEEARDTPTRGPIRIMVSRRRRYFGGPFHFADSSADQDARGGAGAAEIRGTEGGAAPGSVIRTGLDAAVQAVPVLAENHAQTNWVRPQNVSTQSEAREASSATVDGVLASPDFLEFLRTVLPRVEEGLRDNELLDLFKDDYKAPPHRVATITSKEETKLKEHQSFKFLGFASDQTITACDWHPSLDGVLAVAYASKLSFDERVEVSSRVPASKPLVLVWSLADPITPRLKLEAPEDIFAVQFCPTDPRTVAGGCINGQVILWDLGEHHRRLDSGEYVKSGGEEESTPCLRYVAVSSIESSHRTCITDLLWLPPYMEISRTGKFTSTPGRGAHQLLTVAADGVTLFWDLWQTDAKGDPQDRGEVNLRQLDLRWSPLLRVFLTMDTMSEIGGTRASVCIPRGDELARALKDPAKLSNFMFVGSEQGVVVYVDWRPPESESGKLGVQVVSGTWDVHGGSVVCLKRSPFFSGILLSVGGSSFAIIRENVKSTPLLRGESPGLNMTGGEWSLTRPGVFYISKSDGSVDVWDLLDSTYSPAFSQNISSPLGITSLCTNMHGRGPHYLAAGDEGGTLHILDLPDCLSRPVNNEAASVELLLEKEVQRITYFSERAKAKPARAAAAATETTAKPEERPAERGARLKAAYDDFVVEQERFLVALGLKKAEEAPEK